MKLTSGRASRATRFAAQASTITIALLSATQAYAQCVPDPSIENEETVCSGTDADGVVVSTVGTNVTVEDTATVLGSGGPAILLDLPSDSFFFPSLVNVSGAVNGGVNEGILLTDQTGGSGFSFGVRANITVNQGGSVSGDRGIVLGRAGALESSVAVINNAGTITGTSGVAISVVNPDNSFVDRLTNESTGVINGAIDGAIGRIDNAGLIDGGALSAISFVQNFQTFGDMVNSGTITSSGVAATLANIQDFYNIDNSGTISNTGAGVALAGRTLSVTNRADGVISASGGVALEAVDTLNLINSGSIIGDVVVTSGAGFLGSNFVDSTQGIIDGDLILGNADDILVASINGGTLFTGVTGLVDGGAGQDRVQLNVSQDTSFGGGLVLPTGFEQLSILPEIGIIAKILDGFSASAPVIIGGDGTVVNEANLTSASSFFTTDFNTFGFVSFINNGSIETTDPFSSLFTLDFSTGINSFENHGSINSASGGVQLSNPSSFINTADIIARTEGVSLFGGTFNNSGTIRATGDSGLGILGTGVRLLGGFNPDSLNTGTIDGTGIGAVLQRRLDNAGTISSDGRAVVLEFGGTLNNLAGGVVTGGSLAVFADQLGTTAVVANAGTINGDVLLASEAFGSYRYFALPGGVLNGDLTLGESDFLIAELNDYDGTGFAGITGSVNATGSELRLRVRADGTTSVVPPSGFARIGFELFDGAALTLIGSADSGIDMTGTGDLTVDADFAIVDSGAIRRSIALIAPGEQFPTDTSIDIVNNGTTSITRTDAVFSPLAAYGLGGQDTLTNAGVINANDQATTVFSEILAITGGEVVTNDGQINLVGAIGARDTNTFVNNGSITGVDGAVSSIGLQAITSIVNSGTIETTGSSVELSSNSLSIENSGLISSSNALAIGAAPFGFTRFDVEIFNDVSGVIAGDLDGTAIQLGGGYLTNAGTINGNVDLGFKSFGRSFNGAIYTAAGGTINGDLLFGDGNDLVFTSSDGAGVSGVIDGGLGTDALIFTIEESSQIDLGADLPLNFEFTGVIARGEGTVVTTLSDASIDSSVVFGGNGAVINQADINGSVTNFLPIFLPTDIGLGDTLGSFENRATITGSYTGRTSNFANSGSIGSTDLFDEAVSIVGIDGPLSFSNSGQIITRNDFRSADLSANGSIVATNSGEMAGTFVAQVFAPAGSLDPDSSIEINNSGTITGDRPFALVFARSQSDTGDATGTITNSGNIVASGAGGDALVVGAFGTIPQAVNGVTAISVRNSGLISSNGGGAPGDPYAGATINPNPSSNLATGLLIVAQPGDVGEVVNEADGVIEATGESSVALLSDRLALNLDNAGIIRGSSGTVLADNDGLRVTFGPVVAGAILTLGDFDDAIDNTGSIIGSINLGGGSDLIENRSTIDGDVFLGSGEDVFLQFAGGTATGTPDGGDGIDTFLVALDETGTLEFAPNAISNFEFEGVAAIGAETIVTLTSSTTIDSDLIFAGDGSFINQANISGSVSTDLPVSISAIPLVDQIPTSFENEGTIGGGFSGPVENFANSGSIGSTDLAPNAVSIVSFGALTFDNSGTLLNDQAVDVVSLLASGAITASNSGEVVGNVTAFTVGGVGALGADENAFSTFTNAGQIESSASSAIQVVSNSQSGLSETSLNNSGTIVASAAGGNAAIVAAISGSVDVETANALLQNSGMISANNGGVQAGADGALGNQSNLAVAIQAVVQGNGSVEIANDQSGVIEATGSLSTAVIASGGALALENAGIIRGSNGTTFADGDQNIDLFGPVLAGAIHTLDGFGDRVLNTGSVIGSINLGAGSDRIDNRGIIEGDVFLGSGDDTFLQLAGATLNGIVDGGENNDTLIIDATGGGSISAGDFINFEMFSQIGMGEVSYSGDFVFNTISVDDSAVTVNEGQTVSTAGPIAFTGGDGDEIVNNNSLILGGIDLAGGNDNVVNNGMITGAVMLGGGDDMFTAGAVSMAGIVDGGEGTDTYVVDLVDDRTGIGSVVNFEQLQVQGQGTLNFELDQSFENVSLDGVDLNLTQNGFSAGQITGSDQSENVSVSENVDTLALGGGDDSFGIATSDLSGSLDGGTGIDTLNLISAGPVTISGSVEGFESVNAANGELTVEGTLTAGPGDINFGNTPLQLTIADGGTASGMLAFGMGDDMVEVQMGGDIFGSLSLGAGNDSVELSGGIISGAVNLGSGDDSFISSGSAVATDIAGGGGTDTLSLIGPGTVSLLGSVIGIETIETTSGSIAVAGTLGQAGEEIRVDFAGANVVVSDGGELGGILLLGDGDDRVTVESGGSVVGGLEVGSGSDSVSALAGASLTGAVNLGDGDDLFTAAAGDLAGASIEGGQGTDSLSLSVAGDQVVSQSLSGFEQLITSGDGTLSIDNAATFTTVSSGSSLTIATGGSLIDADVNFADGDQTFTIDGAFVGSTDGGTGMNSIVVSAGSEDAPIAFDTVTSFATVSQTGGFSILSNMASIGELLVNGGRFVGAAGTSINADLIFVGVGGTFGSSGVVNGDLTVAGVLSPGSSPGTMTVNGNVTLLESSTSIFEITPEAFDQLIVSGALDIASGATLEVTTSAPVQPGSSFDLVVADGGINGSFSNFRRPDDLFGFLVQSANSIRLVGQFSNDGAFNPQVSASINYANATLEAQPATSPLLGALPLLLGPNGVSNATAFARVTPEAYASATQRSVGDALLISDLMRGPAFAAQSDDYRGFTFGEIVTDWSRFDGNSLVGTSSASGRSTGLFGGIGFGSTRFSVAGFAGYLDNEQEIGGLAAESGSDGIVLGLNGRYQSDNFGLTASIAYFDGDVEIDRSLPGGAGATSITDTSTWLADVSMGVNLTAEDDWIIRPEVGLTYAWLSRDAVEENSASPFALTVARDCHTAGFVDFGVYLGRAPGAKAKLRPFASLGAQYQLQGEQADAVASYSDGTLGLRAVGIERDRLVGTLSGGLEFDASYALRLFGSVDNRIGAENQVTSVSVGLRLAF